MYFVYESCAYILRTDSELEDKMKIKVQKIGEGWGLIETVGETYESTLTRPN